MGHIAADCQMPKRKKGACFKCYQTGHKFKGYLIKELKTDTKKDSLRRRRMTSTMYLKKIRVFAQNILYQICDIKGHTKVESTLNTLLDTGSSVSFIKAYQLI